MLEILKTLRDTPLPIILVIGGLVFLLVPFVRRVSDKVEIETTNKGFAGFIGFILLAIGVGLYVIPSQTAASTPPTAIPQSFTPVIETPRVDSATQVIQPTANIIQSNQDSMNCSFIDELVTKADIIKKLYEGQNLAGIQARLVSPIDVPVGWIVQKDGKDYYGAVHFESGTIASFWSPNSCRPLSIE